MASPKAGWRPTAALLNWAFAHGSSLTPIGELVEPGTATRPDPVAASGTLPQAPTTKAPNPAPNPRCADVRPDLRSRLACPLSRPGPAWRP